MSAVIPIQREAAEAGCADAPVLRERGQREVFCGLTGIAGRFLLIVVMARFAYARTKIRPPHRLRQRLCPAFSQRAGVP